MLMPDDHIGVGSIDRRHLLLIGAGPGLGEAVARRFADDGYRVTLVARSTGGLDKLAAALADHTTDTDPNTADGSDPYRLRAKESAVGLGDAPPSLTATNAARRTP